MKNLVYFLVFFFLITACSVKKNPVFLKVDDVKVLSFKMDTIRLQANAYFKNENNVGGKISTDEIRVLVDGVTMAQVSSEEFKVPANKEFAVPLKVVIPSKKIFSNKGGILGGLLNSVLNNSLKIQFKGDIKYKILGFSKIYTVDKTEELKIKL